MRSLILLTPLCILAITAADTSSKAGMQVQVDRIIHAEMARQKIPGVALAVVKNGEVAVAKGYGLADIKRRALVTPETIFQSASIGKQFTAAAIMTLVESGGIVLDNPISDYLPKTTASWGSITVRHLLTHTSGIPDHEDVIDYNRDYTDSELVELGGNLPRPSMPGERWEYSNMGYVLLGIIITRVSGKFYGDYLRENIFMPLGMKTAHVISKEVAVPNSAAGYIMKKGKVQSQGRVSPSLSRTGDGFINLSLLDFIAWDKGVRARAILSADSWSQILSPATLNDGRKYPYGFAWIITRCGGRLVHQHDGAWQGFSTLLVRYINDDITVIILSNLADIEWEPAAHRILELFTSNVTPSEKCPETD